jgi:dipeptidyl aminopeptidase/acylaminoacyl peptidase
MAAAPQLAVAVVPGANGKIAFSSDEGLFTRRLFTMQPDGSERTQIVSFGDQPAWSPDGTKIAYTIPSSSFSQGPQLGIVNADGTGLVTPTDTTESEFEPAWSRDGTKIAFTRQVPRPGGFLGDEIFEMNADGTGQTQITHSLDDADGLGFSASEPAWSPDANRIAFTRRIIEPGAPLADDEIYVMDADGSDLVRLTHNPSGFFGAPNDLGPSWSPDGSQIVFSSRRDDRFGVFVMNADGSGLHRLADGPGGSWPAWSPDGSRITYASPPHDIVTIKVDGSDILNLTRTTGVSELNPDWQPLNRPPDCSAVRATPSSLGAPNHRLITVTLTGATDPDGDAVTFTATDVTQDEPVGPAPDAVIGPRPNPVSLRAERDGFGDGRVYRVAVRGDDGFGGSCTGSVKVSVPKGSRPATDSAPPSYDSLHP